MVHTFEICSNSMLDEGAQFRAEMVHPARFERTTSAFGGQRSIQLSYGCLWGANKALQDTRRKIAQSPAYSNERNANFKELRVAP